jgi:hypothetical protein
MSLYHGDPLGLSRPPTPYSPLPDLSWGTIKTPRSNRHPPYLNAPIHMTERVICQPSRRLFRQDHLASPWPSEVPNAEIYKRSGRSNTYLVESCQVAIGAKDEKEKDI